MEQGGEYADLLKAIHESLKPYRYTEREELQLRDVGSVQLVITKRRWTVRYVCAVLEAPQSLSTVDECRDLIQRLREGLAVQFARFPYFKELGTYVVLLCSQSVYQDLSQHLSAFYDRTGLHMNVILGLVLVDRDGFRISADATWGLFYSGKHFDAIERTAQQWCQTKRKAT